MTVARREDSGSGEWRTAGDKDYTHVGRMLRVRAFCCRDHRGSGVRFLGARKPSLRRRLVSGSGLRRDT